MHLTIPQDYSFVESSQTTCHITIPASCKNEFLFLLCESNKDIENQPEIPFVTLFGNTLTRVCRIFGGSEPLSIDEQKGLVGELLALSLLKNKFNDEALKHWSRSGLVDIDLRHLGYDFEVKTVSNLDIPEVNVSFQNQLQYKDSITSYLFVMECRSSKTDLLLPTLPELVDEIVETDYGGEHSELGSKFIKCLEKEVECYPWNGIERNRFTTRFDVSDSFLAFTILEGSAADQIAVGAILPNGVDVNKYKLDANVLEKFENIADWLGSE